MENKKFMLDEFDKIVPWLEDVANKRQTIDKYESVYDTVSGLIGWIKEPGRLAGPDASDMDSIEITVSDTCVSFLIDVVAISVEVRGLINNILKSADIFSAWPYGNRLHVELIHLDVLASQK